MEQVRVNNRMDVLRHENPLVGGQVSESYVLFPCSPMSAWNSNVKRRFGEKGTAVI
jgi:hypothetical protein